MNNWEEDRNRLQGFPMDDRFQNFGNEDAELDSSEVGPTDEELREIEEQEED